MFALDFLFLDSTDLDLISRIELFDFFKCTIHYGPDFAFSVCIPTFLFPFEMIFFRLH